MLVNPIEAPAVCSRDALLHDFEGELLQQGIPTKYRSQKEETVCRSERLAAGSGINRGRSVIPTGGSFLTRPQIRRLR